MTHGRSSRQDCADGVRCMANALQPSEDIMNMENQRKLEEAKRYLDKTSYTRAEKFALTKALTGCADKNNPYR